MPTLYPFLLESALHVKVWGGRELEKTLNKALPTDEPYGESWEMHDTAIITNGALAGQSLGAVLREHGAALVGEGYNPADGLPLLVKLLDATQWLSVQVHPNDAQAQRLEGEPRGKTEAWYVIAAQPDAKIIIGFQPNTTKDMIAQALQDNTAEPLFAYANVKAGDVLYIEANTVHALGPGILIYEIQQSSDTTYRLYDWGRVGLDGNPRELHIDKSLEVSNLETIPPLRHTADEADDVLEIVHCPYFVTTRYRLRDHASIDVNAQGFTAITCIDGQVSVTAAGETLNLGIGQTAFIPHEIGAFTLSGTGEILASSPQ